MRKGDRGDVIKARSVDETLRPLVTVRPTIAPTIMRRLVAGLVLARILPVPAPRYHAALSYFLAQQVV